MTPDERRTLRELAEKTQAQIRQCAVDVGEKPADWDDAECAWECDRCVELRPLADGVLALLAALDAQQQEIERLKAERRDLLQIKAGAPMSAEGEAHWRHMCAEDDPRVFGFTNREMRRMFAFLDAARERAEQSEAEVARLKTALLHFGRHTACAAGHSWIWSEADLAVCDCGLAAALTPPAAEEPTP